MTAHDQILRLSEQLAQAEQLRLKRQFDKAESLCAALLRQQPNFYGALYTLGLIHADRGDPAKALPLLLRAVMQGPRNPHATVSLAGVLIESGALDLASHVLGLAEAVAPDDPAVLVTRGELSHRRTEYAAAVTSFQRALELDPAFTEAAVGLARALFAVGSMEEGVRALEDAIARGCMSPDALFTLSQAPDTLITRDLAADADRLLVRGGPMDAPSLASLEFVKAGALHRAGRHAQAWSLLREVNRKIFAHRKAEAKAHAARFDDSLAALRKIGRVSARKDATVPVSLFVLGASRSGKTTLERLIARSAGVRRHFERSVIDEATRWTCQAAALLDTIPLGALPPGLNRAFVDTYANLLAEGPGAGVLHTFTNPEDIHQVARLAGLVPNVRIVCIRRDWHDTAFRIALSHYAVGNAYAYDVQATFAYLQRYDQMIDALAAAAPEIVQIVAYEDLVASPAVVLQQVADLTGVPLVVEEGASIGDDRGCAAPYRDGLDAERLTP